MDGRKFQLVHTCNVVVIILGWVIEKTTAESKSVHYSSDDDSDTCSYQDFLVVCLIWHILLC